MNASIEIPKDEISAFCRHNRDLDTFVRVVQYYLPPLIDQLEAIFGEGA